jgi:hypothetical protein
VKPLVPLTEINQLIVDSCRPVLIYYLVDCSREAFRVRMWKPLFVVEQDACVVVVAVQWFEILRVVRQQDGVVLTAPREQFGVTRPFAEPVFLPV